MLRNTFSAGGLVCKLQCKLQTELWVTEAPGKRPGTANPWHNKGLRDLWHSQVTRHRDTAEASEPQGGVAANGLPFPLRWCECDCQTGS